MFENLDDPNAPNPAPVDAVVARGKQLRLHRRLLIAATALFVVAGTITTAAALQGGSGHKRVEVSTEPSSTTEPETTVPETSSTIGTDCRYGNGGGCTPGTTIDTTPSSTVGSVTPLTPPAPAPTTTTQPPHDPNDLSMVTVSYQAETGTPDSTNFAIPTGESKVLNFTVTNNGSWTVNLPNWCGARVFLWSNPATQAWPPYTNGIWPLPYPKRDPAQVVDPGGPSCPLPAPLAPGASESGFEALTAGYVNAVGDVMPAPPGFTAVRAPYLPQCDQPCDFNLADAVHVTIEPPSWPPPPSLYSINYKTQHMSIPSGQSADAEITYTNGLAFTIRIPLFGPCWHVALGNATVDCSGALPVLIIGPHESADLHGTVWARQGFVQSGAPLAKGRHMINMGDTMSETLSETPAQATWIDVT
jgi:hypothetical protein